MVLSRLDEQQEGIHTSMVPHLRRTIIHNLREDVPLRRTRGKFIGTVEVTTARKNTRRRRRRWRRTSRFLAGFPHARRRCGGRTAVHYFLMSNKAISMCPDQGPQVLTRVISPGSPACATSSSEADPPLFSFLRRLPPPPPLVPDDGAVT